MRWRALLLVAAACGSGAPATGTARTSACNEIELARLDGALASAQADIRPQLAAQGIADACPAFAPALRDALHAFVSASPAERQRGLQKALEQHVDLWNASCAGGTTVIGNSAMLTGPDLARAIWSGCAVAQFDVATADDWPRAKNPVLAVLVHGSLVTAAVAPARVRTYTRALADL